jgi:hypothetical protein
MGSHTCRRNPCTAAFKFWSNVFSMIALMPPPTKLLGLRHLMTTSERVNDNETAGMID